MIGATFFRRAILMGLGWWCALNAIHEAWAQHSADPYKPWNAQYEQYLYPSFPNGSGVSPNQTILGLPTTRSTARSFQSYLDEFDTTDPDQRGPSYSSPSRGTVGVPYYRAYRQLDRAYKRVYRPNDEIDKTYQTVRNARDEKYSEYLSASDRGERAKLKKEYDQLNRKTQRDLADGGRVVARRPSTSPLPSLPDLPPITSPPRRRLPSLTVPETSPRPVTATPRRGEDASSATTRTPTETLKRSEALDRPATPRPLSSPTRRIERSSPR